MSLLKRKPRPVSRSELTERDVRIFFVATDDTYAPKQYLDGLHISRVKIITLPCEDRKSAANFIIDNLTEFKKATAARHDITTDDEFWVLLDIDHNLDGNHKKGFISALDKAHQNNFGIAISNPCFEVWLLLHHVEIVKGKAFANAAEVEKDLRIALGGSYNKTNLLGSDFPPERIEGAIARARALEDNADAPAGYWSNNPSTRVYRLLERIGNTL